MTYRERWNLNDYGTVPHLIASFMQSNEARERNEKEASRAKVEGRKAGRKNKKKETIQTNGE